MSEHDPLEQGAPTAPAVANRTYLFALKDAGGTVPPELGVAGRLARRGHHVVLLGDDSMAQQARENGIDFRPWTDSATGEVRDWEAKSPLNQASDMARSMIGGPAPQQARDAVAVIDELHPDLVLTSFFAFGAMIAAQAQEVPFDVLMPNTYPLPARGMPQPITGLRPARGQLGHLRDRIIAYGGTKLIDKYALASLNELRAGYRLAPLANTWEQVRQARRLLILSSAAFDFPAELPANARYVGPILDDPAWASETRWGMPPGDDPLVLVAMSSTFQDHVPCMQRIVDALGTLPVRGVVTTGPAVAPEAIRAPANVCVVAAAPHHDVMGQMNLVITHGGHGTVVKALVAGVPLVILPHGRDQAGNGVRVSSRGAGLRVSRKATAPRIARAIGTVLNDAGYLRAAGQLGESIARDVAKASLLLDEIEW